MHPRLCVEYVHVEQIVFPKGEKWNWVARAGYGLREFN